MTTPIVNVPMPYGAELAPDGTTRLQIAPGHRNRETNGEVYLAIPDGVSSVSMQYDGPEQVTVNYANSDSAVPTRYKIAEIPSGGGTSKNIPSLKPQRKRLFVVQRVASPSCGKRRPVRCHRRTNRTSLTAQAVV